MNGQSERDRYDDQDQRNQNVDEHDHDVPVRKPAGNPGRFPYTANDPFAEEKEQAMPEGDTVWRAAGRLRDALGGAVLTAASSSVSPAFSERLPGRTVEQVDSRGKHLLVHLSGGLTVHGHLGMEGRWTFSPTPAHRPGWENALRPKWLVLRSDAAEAVCSRAPVIELLHTRDVASHPVLRGLGPDVLDGAPTADDGVIGYARRLGSLAIGELLLDQRLVSGIGNIWRCESLFVSGIHPATPVGELDDDRLAKAVDVASRLMRASLAGRPQMWVYRRAGLPCRRCGTTIVREALGPAGQSRSVYLCPHCQPRVTTGQRADGTGRRP